jgi:hypothetical protein
VVPRKREVGLQRGTNEGKVRDPLDFGGSSRIDGVDVLLPPDQQPLRPRL